MDEFKGWWVVTIVNRDTTKINIEKVICDTNGHILFLVDFNKVYYNFNNIVALKEVEF